MQKLFLTITMMIIGAFTLDSCVDNTQDSQTLDIPFINQTGYNFITLQTDAYTITVDEGTEDEYDQVIEWYGFDNVNNLLFFKVKSIEAA